MVIIKNKIGLEKGDTINKQCIVSTCLRVFQVGPAEKYVLQFGLDCGLDSGLDFGLD